MTRGISRIRKTGVGFIAALTAVAGLIPLATGAGAAANLTVDRIEGADRFGTGAAVAQRFGASPTVIVARADLFPDALASSYVAGLNDAAIMLVRSDGIPATTSSALTAAGATRAIIMGGNTAVNPSVEAALVSRGITTRRIGGPTRWDTAQLAAQDGGTGPISTIGGLRTAIVARGDLFPDALSGGPIAYNGQFPIILTDPGSLIAQARAALQNLGIRRVEILGGTSAVSAAAQAEIASLNGGITVERLEGPVRTATSVAIAEFSLGTLGFTNRRVGLANGLNFPDALTYGSLAGKERPTVAPTGTTQESPANLRANPVLVSASPDALSADARNYMANHSATLTQLEILGGPLAISAATQADATAAATSGAGGTTTVPTTSTTAGPTTTTTAAVTTTTAVGQTTTTTAAPGAAVGVAAGPQLATAAPDLTATEILNGVPNDGIANQVRYRFDATIINLNSPPTGTPANPFPTTGFSVQGYDSETRTGATGAVIEGGNLAVVATFDPTLDLRIRTIGTVDSGAVSNGGGLNTLASKGLTGTIIGTTQGVTEAPVLISASPDPTNNTITYSFDKAVTFRDFTDFGFYNQDGTPTFASAACTPATGAPQTLICPFLPAPPVSASKRFFAEDNSADNTDGNVDSAVERNPQTVNTGDDNTVQHTGLTTDAPDLTGVSRVGGQPNQVDFDFDATVRATGVGVDPSNFAIYNVDGTRQSGIGVTTTGDTTILRVTFPTLTQDNAPLFTRAGVEMGATTESASPNRASTTGGFPLGAFGDAGEGFTDGPDLLLATFTEAANQVKFGFDEDIRAGSVNPGAFFLVLAGGGAGPVGTAFTISGKDVTISYPAGSLAGTTGAGVTSTTGWQNGVGNLLATEDLDNNDNSPDSVGRTG